MISRRTALTVLAASAALPATLPALAQGAPTFARYSQAAFDQALAAGQPIVVHVHADWCPTCRAQQTSFNAIGTPGFRGARLIRVDFDTDKAFLQRFNVRSQSTILVFKGGREVSRLVGQGSREAITQALAAI